MVKNRIVNVKEHFEAEAGIFDKRVVKIVPHYIEMLEALAAAIPFSKKSKITVADLGSGTGTVTYIVKKFFPNAQITCIDISQNMLDVSKQKLKNYKNITFELGEFNSYKFSKKFDAVVASLALHHLEGTDKIKMLKKIYHALVKGGVFVNADIFLSSDKAIQNKYIKNWGEFVMKSFSKKQMRQNYTRYKKEDRPAVLDKELNNLKKAGFGHVELFWKYYNFAVYSAVK